MNPTFRPIIATGVWVPRPRLDLASIAPVAGSGGGRGTRSVSSYDEDTTTMAVEAARRALGAGDAAIDVDQLWFATTEPAYADRTNATAIHAAIGLAHDVGAYDAAGSVRATMGAVRSALASTDTSIVIGSDRRTGLPGSGDEAGGGDAAAAVVVGDAIDGRPALAEVIGWASHTAEFVDRWRAPGEVRSKLWEERFGEVNYVEAGRAAFGSALAAADIEIAALTSVAVTGPHQRAVRSFVRSSGVDASAIVPDLAGTVGQTGAAHPLLVLASWLDGASPGDVLALVSLADGADVAVVRAGDGVSDRPPQVEPAIASGFPVEYGRYLAWRGMLPVEPPRRPEPARVSSSAATRNREWKFGFVGSRGDDDEIHLPPKPGESAEPMAGRAGTIVTYTVDRLAYSPSPPIVFAVVDFDGGGRLPVELTDVDESSLAIGGRVEPTFRRLGSSDGIHNYFWKVRPIVAGSHDEIEGDD